MSTKRVKPEATVPEITEEVLIKAAINEPDENAITIRDRRYELKDFKYKEYMAFMRYMTPVIEMFSARLTAGRSFSLNEASEFNVSHIFEFCEDTLPKMALMVAQHSYPEMTEEQLLDEVPSPFELAELVLAQIVKNQMIEKFAGFLQQMTPMKKA